MSETRGRKPYQSTAMNRRAVLDYIKAHSPCDTVSIRAALEMPTRRLSKHFDYLREMGCIRSTGRGASVRWHFVSESGNLSAKPAAPTEEGVKADRETVLAYVRDHGPCKAGEAVQALEWPYKKFKEAIQYLRLFDHVSVEGIGGNAVWHFKRGLNRAAPLPGVSIPVNHKWQAPAPVIQKLPSGITYTYIGAPKDRFDSSDLLPGTGAISAMNPQLARLAA